MIGPDGKPDLSRLLVGDVSLRPEEHPEDRAARLRAEQRAALIEDGKGIAIFVVLLPGAVSIALLSGYEAFFDPGASADTKRWSQTVLSSLMTGAVSFVIGRRVGK